MLIYLDMCCFNRPFDDQSQDIVRLETEAKIFLQQRIMDGRLQLVWSYMLSFENSANPDKDVRRIIAQWETIASIVVAPDQKILERAKSYQAFGVRAKDALHLACAVEAKVGCFLTVDKGILKRNVKFTELRIQSPLEFFGTEE